MEPIGFPFGRGPAVRGLLTLGVCAGMGLLPLRGEQSATQLKVTGQTLTPLAAPGARQFLLNPHLADNPDYLAGQAVSTAISPDGKTLLVLTSGYNLMNFTTGPRAGRRNPADSHEYVFVYDISAAAPVEKQVLTVPDAFCGIAFAPSGDTFFVAGGVDDNLHVFSRTGDTWKESAVPVALGHAKGLGINIKPAAAGLAVSADGATVVVANYENDSISVVRTAAAGWRKTDELDLRPGKNNPSRHGVAGGEFPFGVAIRGNDTAYISSVRDREVVVVDLRGLTITGRIPVGGQPNKMALNPSANRLYVAEDNNDSIAVIDTGANRLLAEIRVGLTATMGGTGKGGGANTNSVTLAPDGKTLYATNGGENAVAVVRLNGDAGTLAGLIPTGEYPNSVSVSADGSSLYVADGRSPTTPNPGNVRGLTPAAAAASRQANQYVLQLVKGDLLYLPVPGEAPLAALTSRTAQNDHFQRRLTPEQTTTLAALHRNIHHIIYIIKENRTYDQVLGDLKPGDGDPALAEFGQANTPNFHALAREFTTLDRFFCSGDVSGDGWPWSTSAEANDTIEKEIPVNYADRGLTNDAEGTNRDVNVAIAGTEARRAANAATPDDDDDLPGPADIGASDGPEGEAGAGHLWDEALRRGLTVRNYGFFLDLARYNQNRADAIPETPDPASAQLRVAYSTSVPLAPLTDPYFRGFDQAFPDLYREREWAREFAAYVKQGRLPALELVRLDHDHFGNFNNAIDGVNTPELQIADDDYAVGLLVEAVAHSPFAGSTLIVVVEDDAQNGADHVDAHRSPAFIIGPYVRQGAVDSTPYNTVNVVRTMEDILGLGHLNLHDQTELPMLGVFDLQQKDWTYTAVPSALLRQTTLPIRYPDTVGTAAAPRHDAKWWAAQTAGMDFSVEDKIDAEQFNRILWKGIIGDSPYPAPVNGRSPR